MCYEQQCFVYLTPKAHCLLFDNMKAGDYRVRIITDINHNGRWDTGHYASHRQPEPVVVIPSAATVRANWDTNVDFDFGKKSD